MLVQTLNLGWLDPQCWCTKQTPNSQTRQQGFQQVSSTASSVLAVFDEACNSYATNPDADGSSGSKSATAASLKRMKMSGSRSASPQSKGVRKISFRGSPHKSRYRRFSTGGKKPNHQLTGSHKRGATATTLLKSKAATRSKGTVKAAATAPTASRADASAVVTKADDSEMVSAAAEAAAAADSLAAGAATAAVVAEAAAEAGTSNAAVAAAEEKESQAEMAAPEVSAGEAAEGRTEGVNMELGDVSMQDGEKNMDDGTDVTDPAASPTSTLKTLSLVVRTPSVAIMETPVWPAACTGFLGVTSKGYH